MEIQKVLLTYEEYKQKYSNNNYLVKKVSLPKEIFVCSEKFFSMCNQLINYSNDEILRRGDYKILKKIYSNHENLVIRYGGSTIFMITKYQKIPIQVLLIE